MHYANQNQKTHEQQIEVGNWREENSFHKNLFIKKWAPRQGPEHLDV